MEKIKLKAEEIVVGHPLPWPVYDDNQRLLLEKGETITTEHRLHALIEQGLYREDVSRRHPGKESSSAENSSPFQVVDELAGRLNHIFFNIVNKKPHSEKKLNKLSTDIQKLCEWDANAALGAVHLCHNPPYTVWHPLHVSMLSELITRRMGYSPESRIRILNAALTCNIAMLELQETLYRQGKPPSADQRKSIQQHCQHGVGMLRDAGIENDLWLDIVFQHHEKIDGSGYPVGLEGDAIMSESRIISLADRYSAMVSPRGYREEMTAQSALSNLFLKKGKEYDEELSVLFIKELGIYPPGSFVKLINGETAIVIKRGQESTAPIVCSLINPLGESYARPVRRDSSRNEHAIGEICPRIKTTTLNLPMLWGYA